MVMWNVQISVVGLCSEGRGRLLFKSPGVFVASGFLCLSARLVWV